VPRFEGLRQGGDVLCKRTDGLRRLAPDNSGGYSRLMVKSVIIVRCLFKPRVRKTCETVEVWLRSFLISEVDGGEIYAAAALPARRVPGTRVQRGLGGPQELVRTLQRRENSCARVWHRTLVGERVGPSQWRQAAGSQTCVVVARSDEVYNRIVATLRNNSGHVILDARSVEELL